MKENEKIIALDSLRGIAALMVCIFHFTNDTTFLPSDTILHLIGKNETGAPLALLHRFAYMFI